MYSTYVHEKPPWCRVAGCRIGGIMEWAKRLEEAIKLNGMRSRPCVIHM